jgi:hypothetical protein
MKSVLQSLRSTFRGGKKNAMKKFVDEQAPNQPKTEVTHNQGKFFLKLNPNFNSL